MSLDDDIQPQETPAIDKAVDALLGIEAMRECALLLVKLEPDVRRGVIYWLADYFLGIRWWVR